METVLDVLFWFSAGLFVGSQLQLMLAPEPVAAVAVECRCVACQPPFPQEQPEGLQ